MTFDGRRPHNYECSVSRQEPQNKRFTFPPFFFRNLLFTLTHVHTAIKTELIRTTADHENESLTALPLDEAAMRLGLFQPHMFWSKHDPFGQSHTPILGKVPEDTQV